MKLAREESLNQQCVVNIYLTVNETMKHTPQGGSKSRSQRKMNRSTSKVVRIHLVGGKS